MIASKFYFGRLLQQYFRAVGRERHRVFVAALTRPEEARRKTADRIDLRSGRTAQIDGTGRSDHQRRCADPRAGV